MAYTTSNPPALASIGPLTGTNGLRIWAYSSSDAAATVDTANYFTNGLALGMKAGDIVIARDTVNLLTKTHYVVTVGATTTDLGDGTTIGSSTNTD